MQYRGYKTHAAVNVPSPSVTSIEPSMGNTADNKAFVALRAHDRGLDLPVTTYGGDKAYDDTDIYVRLEQEGLMTGITLRHFRTEKRDRNKQRCVELEESEVYRSAVTQRYRVEQPFGLAKKWHSFERCRYLGRERYAIQALFTFLVGNLKRAHRDHLPCPGQRPPCGANPTCLPSADVGVLRLMDEMARQARPIGRFRASHASQALPEEVPAT